MAFNQAYNTDDVLLRSVIIGLLDLLNSRVQITQTMTDTPELITVPFFYAQFGQERFLQDFYLKYKDNCAGPGYVEGGAWPVPRGILTLTSVSVNSASLTSKFVRGTYNKEVDGEVQAYSSYLNYIPLALSFDVEIICNTLLESFKISQSAIGSMYKAAKFNVDYGGFMCPVQVGFSEDYSTEKQLQYTYGDGQDKITLRFTVEGEVYLPIPDPVQERWRGNVMDNGIGNTIVKHDDGTTSTTFDVDVQGTDPRFPVSPNKIYNRDPNGNVIDPTQEPPLDPDVNGGP
jgi:hypothetical protein